jgi:hypothetical protein
MKTIRIALIGLTLVGCQLMASANGIGKKHLPQKIATVFDGKYPGAKVTGWSLRQQEYVVNFVRDKEKCIAYYSTDGSWAKTETRIPWLKDLPAPVRTAFANSTYRQYYVGTLKKVEDPSGALLYRIRVAENVAYDVNDDFRRDYILYYTPDGQLKDKVKTNDRIKSPLADARS